MSFDEHFYLSTSSKLTNNEIKEFQMYIDSYQNLTYDEVRIGLNYLSKLLSKHFGKKPYILMDEYDAGITNSYL